MAGCRRSGPPALTADVGCTTPGGRIYGYPVPAGRSIVGSGTNSACSYQNLRFA